jgi:hypothetical protein
MTIAQIAIVQTGRQLQDERARRPLTAEEQYLLTVCASKMPPRFKEHQPQPGRSRRRGASLTDDEMDRRALANWPAEWGKRA